MMVFSQRKMPGLADTQTAVFKNKEVKDLIYFHHIVAVWEL